ncbi:hypothetical protein ACEQ8H_000269 [Pleosporales sp. CAS-2024a]
MAAATALAHRHLVSLVLAHLSDMTYKGRRQNGPHQPVVFLELRPTLVPSICVNKLWAEVGTSILWNRYPYLPALKDMSLSRRTWYAEKVESVFVSAPSLASAEDMQYLGKLDWPRLKRLELEVDWARHSHIIQPMLHRDMEHLDISAIQSEGSPQSSIDAFLAAVRTSCPNLRTLHMAPDTIDPRNLVQASVLLDLLDSAPKIKDVSVLNAGLSGNDLLLRKLIQWPALTALEVDLDPGLDLLPFLHYCRKASSPFISLNHLHVMCYPEIALALPALLPNVTQLSIDMARLPDLPSAVSDVTLLDDLLTEVTQCRHLQLLRINIGQLAADFPANDNMPVLHGSSLENLAVACPNLADLTLRASEPAAIDASDISPSHFETFCRNLPQLTQLSLKLHPQTTMTLEESALPILGKHCPRLETVRLKIALQLPSLTEAADTSKFNHCESGTSMDIPVTSDTPLFPQLIHLGLACPQTVLSVAASTYVNAPDLQPVSTADPWLEEELVRSWAHSLLRHFPKLDILEAWGDWTGQENESLNYFLPREEPLASTWEFLSGAEQDLWADVHDDTDELERWDSDFEQGISFRGSGDWDRASLINEYPSIAGSGFLETFEEEPEDMVTPIDGKEEWSTSGESRATTILNSH